jgi:hypothetical protein
MQDLRILSIANGKFTANGNFSGYTLTGERVHIFGRQMASANFDADSVDYPFPVLATNKSYEGRLNADGTREAGIVDRLTALAVFTNEDAMAAALAADKGLAARVEAKVAKRVRSLMADLSPEAALGA